MKGMTLNINYTKEKGVRSNSKKVLRVGYKGKEVSYEASIGKAAKSRV